MNLQELNDDVHGEDLEEVTSTEYNLAESISSCPYLVSRAIKICFCFLL